MIEPWPTAQSRHVGDYRIFSIRSDLRVSPRTGQQHDFFVLDAVDWVNVIALTPQREIILVEQFRHGTETVEVEIPGGMIDPHDGSPVVAAVRELREETGYEGEKARLIGQVFPNPAIMSNTCHFVLIENCVQRHSVSFDYAEDILTRAVPVNEAMRLVQSGRIQHALVVAALFHFHLNGYGASGDQPA